ncbi:MAG: NAD(P)/FAD-dependent oxidoreductase, partial [Leptolyngbyaceae cyanobacterium]
MKQIIVIGGGAAGLFGAIACAQANPNHAKVTILEAGAYPLTKVKISGGGRCNVTHACFDPDELVAHYPRGHRVLKGAFRQFQPQDTIAWFAHRGVALKTETDGRVFPTTNTSQTIIDCLLDTAFQHRVTLDTRSMVKAGRPIAPSPSASVTDDSHGGVWVQLKAGKELRCDRLL